MNPISTSSRFKTILFTLYVIVAAMLLLGRSHFALGTALYLLRWPLLLLGALFFITIRKTGFSKRLKIIAIVLCLFIAEYAWDQFSRASLRHEQCTQQLNILTYNVFFKNRRPEASLKVMKESNPDIIALQEVTPQWEQELDKALSEEYRYKRMLAMKGTHGMAVYSRYPIAGDTVLNDDAGRPVAMFVHIEAQGKRVLIINTHLASPAAAVEHPENFLSNFSRSYTLRKQQLDDINRTIAKRYSDFAVKILTGDLNTLRCEPIYQQGLMSHWVNLFDEKGTGSALNFPNSSKSGPMATLDYILLQGNAVPVSATVKKGGSSDHCAIAGSIKF